VLNGVGGRTVAEAKERLSYAEYLDWCEYIRLRGSLHVGMRLEVGFALIAMVINRAIGGTANVHDFTPHIAEPEASIEDVMKILGGGK
jgi:hypothetical protein